MFRSCILLSAILLWRCASTKDYNKEHILEFKKNQNDVTIYKKIRTLFKSWEGDKYIVSYQDFDSLGRKIKEYGFEGPPSPYKSVKYIPDENDKYLIEYFYTGNHMYLKNLYIWPSKIDSLFVPSGRFLSAQTYIPDSINKINGLIEMVITKYGDSITIGNYRKFKPAEKNTFVFEENFDFAILTSQMQFNNSGIFNIKYALDTIHFNSKRNIAELYQGLH